MTNILLQVLAGGGLNTKNSSSLSMDLTSVLIGASNLEIKEVSGNLDFGAVKLVNLADGTSDNHAVTKGQMDTADALKQDLSEKGANSGYAELDGGGKVPITQLPTNLMQFKGAYNATTNTPTLVDAVGDAGDTFRVSVAGSQDFGSGSITFGIGDWIFYNGTIWQKADNTDEVTSVNGNLGVVVLVAADLDYTPGTLTDWDGDADPGNTKQALDQLAERVDDNEGAIASGDQNASEVEYTPAVLTDWDGDADPGSTKDALDQLAERVDDNETLIGTNSTNIGTNATDIGTNSTDIGTNSTDIGTNSTDIGTNSTDIGTNTTDIGTNSTDIAALQLPTESLVNGEAGAQTIRKVAFIKKADGKAHKAIASEVNVDETLAMVSDASIAAAATGEFIVKPGEFIDGFSAEALGPRYVDPDTEGEMTATPPPFVNGNNVYEIGRFISATRFLFNPRHITKHVS